MAKDQEVRTTQAAKLKGMSTSLFIYYITQGRCPRFEERAGVRFFRESDVLDWTPSRLKRGRKKASHAAK